MTHIEIRKIDIEGYRSLRDLGGDLDRVTVLVGPNGVGKSNLYRSLQLLSHATERQLARAIASEGGMHSVVWAGPKWKKLKSGVCVRVEWDELEYELHIGKEVSTAGDINMFPSDPYVKTEKIWSRHSRRVEMVRRAGPVLKYRDDEGHWTDYPHNLACNESMLSQLREPRLFPLILRTRMAISGWRFYHSFRGDLESPLRREQPVFRTGALDSNGDNLAAALMSIQCGKNSQVLESIIAKALPGAQLKIKEGTTPTFRTIGFTHPTIRRWLSGSEMSDGTLRFFALAAALLNEEPPEFLVLNEPENSLHPSTFPALAEAIEFSASRSQVLIVTHSQELANEIALRYPTTVRALRWDAKRGTRLDDQISIEQGTESDEDGPCLDE